MLDRLAEYAVTYYHDFVKPAKQYRLPDDTETKGLSELAAFLKTSPAANAEEIQAEVYAIGKRYYAENLRGWFQALYETLLGQSQGPRMGSFIALYGAKETLALIERVLKGESLAA